MTEVRRGRRPGAPDTRSAILAAARAGFASHGYAGATIRAIAGDAGVDPALVHHYFGSKDELFIAALELPVDPRDLLAPAVAGDLDDVASRLLRVFLRVWDDPSMRLPLLGLVRGVGDPDGQRLVKDGFVRVVVRPLAEAMGVDQPERRTALVVSQVIGLIVTRYLLELEPVASMPPDELVATYAPTLQRYLTGDLPG